MPKTQVWNSWRQTCLSIAQGCQSFFVVPWFDQTSTSKWWICWACVSQEWIRIRTDDRFFCHQMCLACGEVEVEEKALFFIVCIFWELISISARTANKSTNTFVSCPTWMTLWWKCQRCGMNITLGGSFGNHCHGWCGYSSFDASCHGNVFDSAFILEYSWIIQNEFLHACNSWCGQSFHALQVPLASKRGSQPRRVPNSFQVHRGSCDPRFTCSSNSEDSRFVEKHVEHRFWWWYNDDTCLCAILPALSHCCLMNI